MITMWDYYGTVTPLLSVMTRRQHPLMWSTSEEMLSGSEAVDNTLARLSGGDVTCWGRNDDGQIGYGNIDTVEDDEPQPLSARWMFEA